MKAETILKSISTTYRDRSSLDHLIEKPWYDINSIFSLLLLCMLFEYFLQLGYPRSPPHALPRTDCRRKEFILIRDTNFLRNQRKTLNIIIIESKWNSSFLKQSLMKANNLTGTCTIWIRQIISSAKMLLSEEGSRLYIICCIFKFSSTNTH